jgi:mRNA deadenylase 3'-5' endonuclease subunit Ccr4
MEREFIDFYTIKNQEQKIDSKYPEFTTFKYRKKEGGFIKRTIDYMFVSKNQALNLKVTGWIDPPEEDQLDKEIGSPSVDYPSDHFSLAYEVAFTKPFIKRNQNNFIRP